MTSSCIICNSAETHLCKQCHAASYCSTACQKRDWPCHKLLCSSLSTETERPSPRHKRGILFRPDRNAPELAWIKCDEQPGDDYSPVFDIPDLRQIMGLPFQKLTRTTFWKNFVRGRELKYLFETWMGDNFLNDGSLRNQSAAAATKGNMAHDWRGPLVVLKYNDLEERSRYADMGLQDFRDAVDYLTYYTNEDAWSKYWTGR